jgi:hypothetical protein
MNPWKWPPPVDILTLKPTPNHELSRSISMMIPLKNARSPSVQRNAATLARWILSEEPDEVYVPQLMREVRLSGLRSVERIEAAAEMLIKANWLYAIVRPNEQGKIAYYAINPRLWEPVNSWRGLP